MAACLGLEGGEQPAAAVAVQQPIGIAITDRLCKAGGMSTAAPVLSPRRRQPTGCCETAVKPDLDGARAVGLAGVAKALGDPTRLQLLDVVRKSAPEAVCQCELVPLFEMSQAGLAKHLKVLVDAGVLASERRGTWTYYYARVDGLKELTSWLS